MTRTDILLNSVWTEGKMTVHSPFFNQEVRVDLVASLYNLKHTKSIISERFVAAVNDFLTLSEAHKPRMESLLYKHCVACCEAASYGFEVLPGETETEANMREFGVSDKASAFNNVSLDHVRINEADLESHRFVRLVFYPEWEQEHGCELILRDGELLDVVGENDTYLGQFVQ